MSTAVGRTTGKRGHTTGKKGCTTAKRGHTKGYTGQPWTEEEKDVFNELLPSFQGRGCNIKMAKEMNYRFPDIEEKFTKLHCQSCCQQLKKQEESQERKRLKQGNHNDGNELTVHNNTQPIQPKNEGLELNKIPLPSSSEWVDDILPDRQKI